MVWYFIGVYVVNRALHDRFELRHFSCVYNTRKDLNFVSPSRHMLGEGWVVY